MAELDPVLKPQDADKILSSIQEWMIQQAANPTNLTEDMDKSGARKEIAFSPSIAPAEPCINPQAVSRQDVRLTRAKKGRVRRALAMRRS
jgi:hypothetical protein